MNHEILEHLHSAYAHKKAQDSAYVERAVQELMSAPDFREQATLRAIQKELSQDNAINDVLRPFALDELKAAMASSNWQQVEKLARCLSALDAMSSAEITQAVDSVLDAGDVVVGGVYA